MLRLAVLSYWHVHARDYEREALAHPDTEISVIWDEDAERGAAQAAQIGARFEPDLATVLADKAIDGVIVTTATSEHPWVMKAAARAGKHIFTEKVIAATTVDAQAVLDAVDDAGVIMMVCLPRISNGYTQTIKAMIDSGDLGRIGYMRMRVGHNGAVRSESDPEGWLPAQFYKQEEALGGAVIDLGAHPLYLSVYFLGTAETVSATYGHVTNRGVEDHAVVTLGFRGGAIGVAEVSFIDQPGTFEVEIHGERGVIRIAQPEMELKIRRARADRRERSEWEAVPVPEDLPSPFIQWVEHVEAQQRNDENLKLALELTRLAEAANRSAESGSVVRLSR
jgi:predicted dehydrogenase